MEHWYCEGRVSIVDDCQTVIMVHYSLMNNQSLIGYSLNYNEQWLQFHFKPKTDSLNCILQWFTTVTKKTCSLTFF